LRQEQAGYHPLVAETPVVTAFVERPDGNVLILRRASGATTYAGLWAGVSGYLEHDDALAQAYVELEEETGLAREEVELVGTGPPLHAENGEGGWLVHPFVFRSRRSEVRLNEENAESEWVSPAALAERESVPGLADAYLLARFGDRVARIRDDRLRGASALAADSVDALVQAAELGLFPLALGRALAGSRPAMGAIANAVGRVLAPARTPEQVVYEAHALLEGHERAPRAIAVLAQPYLEGTVMTHSASATVREAILHSPPDRVVCTVSEPGEEGRAFSEELRAEGVTAELVADDDAEHAIATVNLFLVGADTVFRDGALANKIGTSQLAKAAKDADVPVVVACETLKLAPFPTQEPEEDIFDLTPPRCIDAYVTEEGEFPCSEIHVLVDRTPFLREGYEILSR
jgi:translation initiation factor 2B subunit (eIF-2B alpha/beta/delta family)/8-oxo-dGTP pyrophosphatase MutT (NUDIX family)